MTRPAALWAHLHITEREPDGTWEDCTFTAGLMHARVAHSQSTPATHDEMQKLRAAAGLGTSGGANTDDLQRGYLRRYGWTGGSDVKGFANLWAALKPGRSAAAQGSMAAFARGHHLRRWDPGFQGAHDVFVARVDTTDRVWWDDPLAPLGVGYEGEWVTKAALKAYVDRLTSAGGHHVVSSIVPRPAGAVTVEGGLVAYATVTPAHFTSSLRHVSSGGHLVKIWTPGGASQSVVLKAFPAFAEAYVISQYPNSTKAPHGSFYRLTARPYAGWYVATNVVTVAL